MDNLWIPKTKTGRWMKSGKIQSIEDVLERKLVVKEPEIVDYLCEVVETTLKTMNIGSAGQYRRKVSCPGSYIGFGNKCPKNTKLAVARAARNARLKLFKFLPQNETVPIFLTGEHGDVSIFIAPVNEVLIASLMTRFVLNLVGMHGGIVTTDSENDNSALLEAIIAALSRVKSI